MTVGALIIGLLMPILLGFALAVLELRGLIAPWISAIAMGIAILAVYLVSEGLPPFPPISSKHKLAYALAGLLAVTGLTHTQSQHRQALVSALFVSASFVWLIQRPILAGRFEWHWLLPIATIAAISSALAKAKPQSQFAWPVAALSMSVAASLIALLGGFIGLGQTLLSVSALLGGYTLAHFMGAFHSSSADRGPSKTIGPIVGCLLILFVQLSTFATNLSVAAYLLLLALAALPFADPKFSRLPITAQPFAFAALALLPSAPAILLALRNF